MTGKVKSITDRGFGFLFIPGDPTGDHFFHCNDFTPREDFDRLKPGVAVEFQSINEAKGLRAIGVRVVPQ